MYKISRVNGQYLAINKEDKSEVYVIPDTVFTKMIRNGVSRNNISDNTFLKIKQMESSIVPYKCFDELNKKETYEVKEAIENRGKKIEILKDKKKKNGNIKVNRSKIDRIKWEEEKDKEERKEFKKIAIRATAAVMALVVALGIVDAIRNKNRGNDNNNDDDYVASNDSGKKITEDSHNDDNTLNFYYEEYTNISNESAENAMQYLELCKKYGEIYGEDYRLLLATLAQELDGVHKLELDTPAIGVAQLEKAVWVNTSIRAYNFETGKYEEKWLIAPNAEDTIDNEEFNKRPKSGDIIEKYGKENTINIETVEGSIQARAMIDANYAEQAYKNGATDKIAKSDFQAYVKARENKGPIVYMALEYGDEWKNHLDVTNNGDDDYYKKIYAYADMISALCNDNSAYVTRVFDGKKLVVFPVKAISHNKITKSM
ncbi:MAG: hypothetical protein VZS44_03585 [Bacilli bacterium]|nr:hypothetical protein [Bacilli bacterium]